jgi:hypothetical protein
LVIDFYINLPNFIKNKKMTTTTIMIQLQLFYSAIKRLQSFSTIEIFISNLHLVEIQKIIKKELKDKSGIYGFICKTNNKLYIGSSINLNMRFRNHTNGTKSNILLQRAINKYNLQDFIFIIFEYCEPDKLILREQFYIDELKPEYNILKVAGSSLGYKHNYEILAKMSEARKSKCHSAETKQKIGKSSGIPIFVYDLKGSLDYSFPSASKAREFFKISQCVILNHAKNGTIFKKQWLLSTSLITKKE